MTDTTTHIQAYLLGLGSPDPDAKSEVDDQQVQQLLARACDRLQRLCSSKLNRDYPRLTRAPFNVQSDEVLGGVIERLMKALRQVQPKTTREFFQLANRHIQWELNEIARSRNDQPRMLAHRDLPQSPDSESCLSLRAQQILIAIGQLPDPVRETFELVRIQGLTQLEAADILDVDERTVRRRLNQAVCTLSDLLDDHNSTR